MNIRLCCDAADSMTLHSKTFLSKRSHVELVDAEKYKLTSVMNYTSVLYVHLRFDKYYTNK